MIETIQRRSAEASSFIVPRPIQQLGRGARALRNAAVQWTRAIITSLLIACMVPLGIPDVYAQEAPAGRPGYTQLDYAELDQMVAPIALYPDSLVAQILAGATYSSQIVEADRFVQRNAGMPPQQLAHLVNAQPWDPSVKALTEFPSVLSNLDRNLDWTTSLGNAYYNQPQDVMGAVQAMRQRAYAAGTLRPTPQQTVVYQPGSVVIAPVSPAVYYVPYYNPWVVYGAPVPVYPAYYYAAPLAPVGGVAVAAAIGFTAGVFVGAFASYGWGCGHWAPNWYSHTVVYNHATYVSHSVTVVNRGYYGTYDHSSAARAYNHQVYVGPNGGVTSRTAVRAGGQTDVYGRGPNGGTYDRTTNHYAGGSSTSVTGPDGGNATHTVTGRGTGDPTATTTGPKGNTATTTANGLGTGDGSATHTGPRGTKSWQHH